MFQTQCQTSKWLHLNPEMFSPSQYCNVKRDNYILLQYIHIGSIGRKLRRIVDTVFFFLKVLTEPWIISNKTHLFLSYTVQRLSWEIRSCDWQVQGEIKTVVNLDKNIRALQCWLYSHCTVLTFTYSLQNKSSAQNSPKISNSMK